MDSINSGNVVAFLLGFLMAGLLGHIATKIRAAKGAMGAPWRPMGLQTKETPADVYRKAANARRQYILLWLVLLLLVGFCCFVLGQLAISGSPG